MKKLVKILLVCLVVFLTGCSFELVPNYYNPYNPYFYSNPYIYRYPYYYHPKPHYHTPRHR